MATGIIQRAVVFQTTPKYGITIKSLQWLGDKQAGGGAITKVVAVNIKCLRIVNFVRCTNLSVTLYRVDSRQWLACP